jgi:L,D-peptidoglycan transpeptidase YkuD (ErfK/YbiS/YcfS/YnhG family)
VLGFPTTNELRTPNGVGRFNHFQGGSIYWSPAGGAHGIYGAIRDRWAAAGWETSALGFPTSDEYALGGGRAQDFQRGSIRWTPAGGAVVTGAALPLGATPPGNQLITVVAPSPGSTTATLTAWQRGPQGWTAVLGPVPARVGSAGVGAASEGSTRTPAGTFALTTAFGRAGNPGTALPYRLVDRTDWWVSDVNSPLYNSAARCAPGSCPFNERAGENLQAAGSVYDHAVVIDYNRGPVVRGAGSAFFLHIGNGAPTAGCVAVDRGALQQLMRWLQPAAAPVIAIGVG